MSRGDKGSFTGEVSRRREEERYELMEGMEGGKEKNKRSRVINCSHSSWLGVIWQISPPLFSLDFNERQTWDLIAAHCVEVARAQSLRLRIGVPVAPRDDRPTNRADDLMSVSGGAYLMRRSISSTNKYVDHILHYAKPADLMETLTRHNPPLF